MPKKFLITNCGTIHLFIRKRMNYSNELWNNINGVMRKRQIRMCMESTANL